MDRIAALRVTTTIVSKTCTLEPFAGNPRPNYRDLGQVGLNCKGMPNEGYVYYRGLWGRFTSQGLTYVLSVDAADRPALLSMLSDYDAHLARHLPATGALKEWVELNASCPNKHTQGKEQPRLLSFDPEELSRLLSELASLNLQFICLAVKLAPFTDRWLLGQVAGVLARHAGNGAGLVRAVVCSNTIPNAYSGDALSRTTSGMSGLPTKLLAQANIVQLKEAFTELGTRILLVGCGGVECQQDVSDFLRLGADAVQVGRALHLAGPHKLAELSGKRLAAL